MKRFLPLLVLLFTFVACDGAPGPAGPEGDPGPQGPTGPQGDPVEFAVQTFAYSIFVPANGTEDQAFSAPIITTDVFNNGAVLTYVLAGDGSWVGLPFVDAADANSDGDSDGTIIYSSRYLPAAVNLEIGLTGTALAGIRSGSLRVVALSEASGFTSENPPTYEELVARYNLASY